MASKKQAVAGAAPSAPKEKKFKTITEKRLVSGHKVKQRKGEGWKETGECVGESVIMTRERKVEVTE